MAFHLFEEKKKQEDPNIPEEVLEVAHSRAEKIIERALQKSEEILNEMEGFRSEMKTELQSVFKQTSDSFMQAITEQSKQFGEACSALVPQIKEKFISDVDTSLESFKLDFSKELKARIDQEWAQAQKEIQEYKVQRMQQLEAQVATQVGTLAKELLGKSLTVAQHQELVMNALEKAKQEGVFNT